MISGILLAALAGLLFSMLLPGLMGRQLLFFWRWPWAALALHLGLWGLAHGSLTLLLGRPWFSAALVLAFLMLLVQVSNAKQHSLREPFVFQDFEYFTDAIRHPRLYIPFLGWGKFFLIAVAVVAALATGMWLEEVPAGWWGRFGGAWGAGSEILLAILLLVPSRLGVPVSFEPLADLRNFGLLACLWSYAQAERRPLVIAGVCSDVSSVADDEQVSRASPAYTSRASLPWRERGGNDLPHLVAIQSESFFDPRPLFSGIRPEVLSEFDRVCSEAIFHGALKVPAWGANTVRSEFAFLSGLPEKQLGGHRFNPYRRILAANLPTLASRLRLRGYRTVCIHPYFASFYRRDRVLPHLGFDEFIDIRAFSDSDFSGPYVGDLALGDSVAALLQTAKVPTFVFAITMENHGPLHLESVIRGEEAAFYSSLPPCACDDLTIYLRHLRHADQMLGNLCRFLMDQDRQAFLCWYGDHVPIMPSVYRRFGSPSGDTAYFIWGNRNQGRGETRGGSLDCLAAELISLL